MATVCVYCKGMFGQTLQLLYVHITCYTGHMSFLPIDNINTTFFGIMLAIIKSLNPVKTLNSNDSS